MKWKFRYKSSKGFKLIKLGFYKRFRFTTLWFFFRQIEIQYYDTKDGNCSTEVNTLQLLTPRAA